MATTETWVLDGTSLTSGNFDVMELNVDPPPSRPEWISAADSEGAALVRQPLHENRKITMKLRITPQASMNAALDQLGAIQDKIRKASATVDGIALVWTPANSTRSVTFDVLAGQIQEMPITLSDDGWSWFKQRPIFTIELTAKPYWRGVEVLTSTASSSTPFTTIEVANVPGDVPALGRLIVTDTASQNRRHIEWGLENQYYNSGLSLLIDSDNMVTSGFSGAQATVTGAYDPNATGNNAITISAVSGEVAAVCGTGNQSHIGVYRVKARVQGPTAGSENVLKTRLTWRAGDGPLNSNAWSYVPMSGAWVEVDLGLITVPPVTSGTQRWTGQVETQYIPGATVSLHVDYLILVPAGEGYGKARATYQPNPSVAVARDSFSSLGLGTNLAGRTADAGGAWSTSGDATDLTGNVGLVTASDTGIGRVTNDATVGRVATVPTNRTDVDVSVQVGTTLLGGAVMMGALARWVDNSNFLWAGVGVQAETSNDSTSALGFDNRLFLRVRVAAANTTVYTPVSIDANVLYTVQLIAFTTGRVIVRLLRGASEVARLDALVTAAATGGALATGLAGIVDKGISLNRSRFYDNFVVGTPSSEPIALYSGRILEVRYDGVIRQDSTGTYTGPPASYRGTRFLVPVGTSRVLAKARRSDVDVSQDANVTDATQVQVGYTPRGVVVPR